MATPHFGGTDFLKARTDWQEAQIRLDLARQKLAAFGLSQAEVETLPQQPIEGLRRQEVRAPIAGRITARPIVLGAAVTADAEVYTVADLSVVWVELAVPTTDIIFVTEGMTVRVRSEGDTRGEGRLVFLSPVLDPETRSARAVVEMLNPNNAFRPGGYVTADLATAEQPVDVLILAHRRSADRRRERERTAPSKVREARDRTGPGRPGECRAWPSVSIRVRPMPRSTHLSLRRSSGKPKPSIRIRAH